MKIDFVVGETIQVVVRARQRAVTCVSRILELTRSQILISWPERHHVRIPVEVDEVDINVVRSDAVYSGTCPVVRRDEEAIVLDMPDSEHVRRIQRRDFVRVPAGLPAALKVLEIPDGMDGPSKLGALMLDVSGGGCALRTNESLPEGTLVALAVDFPESGPLVVYGRVQRVTRRLVRDQMVQVLGLQFIDLDETTRSAIVRYVFARQREASLARSRQGGGSPVRGGGP
ncbi:MAG: PilZ domain-containing protein [bacterium]|nr:PilZ domain-containing protein [bacterium]